MIKVWLIALFVIFTTSLPYVEQMAWANSLIVGRDDLSDLYEWTCKVCNASNRPLHAHIVE